LFLSQFQGYYTFLRIRTFVSVSTESFTDLLRHLFKQGGAICFPSIFESISHLSLRLLRFTSSYTQLSSAFFLGAWSFAENISILYLLRVAGQIKSAALIFNSSY
jgi:hypothetical protein